MIIKETDDIARNILIVNALGKKIYKVKEFDTETKKAVMYAMILTDDSTPKVAIKGNSLAFWCIEGERTVVTFECHLLGCKAIDKTTGEEIK